MDLFSRSTASILQDQVPGRQDHLRGILADLGSDGLPNDIRYILGIEPDTSGIVLGTYVWSKSTTLLVYVTKGSLAEKLK